MRIQHNIAAMNSYRNLGVNNTALGKNLEKLSSGYKINRAGDDAAGLAISEKMRAQITGLQKAQDNANDGIALVQTAEGALTEVHSMLNRMTELANQSANGTYQNEIDRENLQKEVASLKSEIDRIAESTNFNGINLLDGSLAGGAGKAGIDTALSVQGHSSIVADALGGAQVTQMKIEAGQTVADGDKVNVSLEMSDGTKFDLTFDIDSTNKKIKQDGTDVGTLAAAGTLDNDGLAEAIKTALSADTTFTEKYSVAVNGTTKNQLDFTSAESAFGVPYVKSATVDVNGINETNSAGSVTTAGKGVHSTVNVANMEVYDVSNEDRNKNKAIITVDGQQFAFAKDEASAKELGSNVNVIITGDNTAPDNADAGDMISLMNQKLGTNIETPATGTSINMITKGGYDQGFGKGLTLQIGDTADDFNKLTVSVESMSSRSLGIDSVDISTQDGASAAIEKIKNAINSVSSTRGDLGAIQNRLEHTINNLGVTEENMTSAESRIRDTDMAAEMMEYTKNNILIQASQAMLAQANQLPQGVLQLLG